MFPAPDKLAQNAGMGLPTMSLDGLVMEPKYDGFRLLAQVTETGVSTYTRTGNRQDGKLPLIERALSALPAGTWLDGELVAFNNGANHWGTVQSVMGSNTAQAAQRSSALTYVVFDVLTFDGIDIRRLPLAERRAALEQIVAMVNNPQAVVITPQFPASYDSHEALVAQGWEGTIVKDPTKPYASGKRGQGWTKLKMSDELDVIVTGFEAGSEYGAIVFGQYKDGVLTQRGKCKRYSHCADLKVGDVISVTHMGIMESGKPRHAMYTRLRIDKPAQECVWPS